MKKTIKYLTLAMSISSVSSVLPITQTTANTLTLSSALVGAGLTYYVFDNPWDLGEYRSDALFVGGASLCATGLMHYITSFITPSGRFGRAKSSLERVRNNPFSLRSFTDENELMDTLQKNYLHSDYPLIDAFNDMNKLFVDCRNAIDLLNAAKIDSIEERNFIQLSDQLIFEAKDMLVNLASAIKVIKASNDFLEQLKLFKKEQLAKQQIAAMNSQANAQWHSAQVQWHHRK